jgi:polyribonucleotide nucleotidyltransferase
MVTFKVEREIGGRLLTIETGKLAKQAAGSALVKYGDTVVLVTVVHAEPRPGIDFFPLTVDYREKTYAAGKFPGGFYKREGRPTHKEILTCRLIDRPLRPLFHNDFINEVLIQAIVLSADQENDPDILAMVGASAAVSLAGLPFDGPVGAARIGRVDGELVVNPTHSDLERSELDMVLGGHRGAINMIEVGARELPESIMTEAIAFGHRHIVEICEMISELAEQAAKPQFWTPPEPKDELPSKVRQMVRDDLLQAKQIPGKQERQNAVAELREKILEELSPADAEAPPYPRLDVAVAFESVEKEVVRELLLQGKRPDGRKLDELRKITSEVAVMPRTHGSAIFTRGETQALVVTTLGTVEDEQIVDGLIEEYSKKFMLHYNFPPFCTGEVKRIMGPGRREIGHGALAERSLEAVLPSPEQFPYTIRVVSDILESNGSSSMATVCGGTLSLMDAGVPIARPVAGISVGLVGNGGEDLLLVDIVGEEDFFGDMDFKVAGTQKGITAIQLDLKRRGLSQELIARALELARKTRLQILKEMLKTLDRPRTSISEYAPRLLTIKIHRDKIGKVIGPGGRGIKKIQDDTGATINIEDDGTVTISAATQEAAEAAKEAVELIAEDVKVGRIYTGRVMSIKDFGAFVELTPGQDGLCHISELSDGYVRNVTDVCQIGDIIKVKVIAVDEQGRVKLSRKQAMREEPTEPAIHS